MLKNAQKYRGVIAGPERGVAARRIPCTHSVISYKHPSVISYKHPSVIGYKHPSVIGYKHPSVISYKHPSVIGYKYSLLLSVTTDHYVIIHRNTDQLLLHMI